MMQQEMTLTRWLFNPFVRIAGTTSLVVGLGAIGLGGLVAAAVGIRFDGLVDMHFVGSVSLVVADFGRPFELDRNFSASRPGRTVLRRQQRRSPDRHRRYAGLVARSVDSGGRDLQPAVDSRFPRRIGGSSPGGQPCCTGSRSPRRKPCHGGRGRLDGRTDVERVLGFLSHERGAQYRAVRCRDGDWGGGHQRRWWCGILSGSYADSVHDLLRIERPIRCDQSGAFVGGPI